MRAENSNQSYSMRCTTLFAAAFFLASAGAAWACPGADKGHGKGHHGKSIHGGGPLLNAPAGHLQKGLELDDEQVSKLGAITKALKEAIATDRETMRELHVELRALWSGAGVPERSAVAELQTKMREHRDNISEQVLTARLEASAVLSQTQRETLATKSAAHGHACGGHCKGGHGKGGHHKGEHGKKGGEGYKCPHAKGGE